MAKNRQESSHMNPDPGRRIDGELTLFVSAPLKYNYSILQAEVLISELLVASMNPGVCAHAFAHCVKVNVNLGAGLCLRRSRSTGSDRPFQGVRTVAQTSDLLFLPYCALEIDDDNDDGGVHARYLVAYPDDDLGNEVPRGIESKIQVTYDLCCLKIVGQKDEGRHENAE
ncbi:hypothetical protein K438DRAFT_1766275 [Mycena galopus ATCC 62051]|nr:hypothetical protein K438DRAFT_1766275 [Mycena galopus ATCC 62051]